MKKALVIGGGFAGCAAAHQLVLQGGWEVTLIESASFLGGGNKTLWYGGHPHTFGPRHFLTQNEQVYAFLNEHCPLRRCNDHVFLTYVQQDDQFYNYPIHYDDVPRMPEADQIAQELAPIMDERKKMGKVEGAIAAKNLEEFWVASVGQTLYDKFIKSYSKKMWLVDDNRKIDDFGWSPKGVALKEGGREAWDVAISAYPIAADGYDEYFRVATAGVQVRLNTRIDAFDIPKKTVHVNGKPERYDVIVNTISPDLLFEKAYGELPYVGRDFHAFVLPIAHAFPPNVYFIYYAGTEKFTRIVEYKQFTRQRYDDNSTILGLEIPSRHGRYYPMPIQSEYARAERYLSELPEGVFSIGRAGSYQYRVDIDDCIEQAMDVARRLK